VSIPCASSARLMLHFCPSGIEHELDEVSTQCDSQQLIFLFATTFP